MNKKSILYILWIFLAWSIYVIFLYAKVASLPHVISISINELIRFIIFAGLAIWMIIFNKASLRELGLIGFRNNALKNTIIIYLFYIITCVFTAIFIQDKTFKVPLEYSFWFTSFSISTISEEICFRGLLFFLFSGLNKKFVVFITSILFSAIHFLGWYVYSTHLTLESFVINAISIFILGCVLGWIYLKTHSIWATSFLHSINNLLAVGFV